MAEETNHIDDLCRLRGDLTNRRRQLAERGDLDGVIESQRQIELLEHAIEDENMLFRKEHKHLVAFI